MLENGIAAFGTRQRLQMEEAREAGFVTPALTPPWQQAISDPDSVFLFNGT